jgi:hypothetical protein
MQQVCQQNITYYNTSQQAKKHAPMIVVDKQCYSLTQKPKFPLGKNLSDIH